MAGSDVAFGGSIPALYDRYLKPLLFDPYAADLVRRLSWISQGSVLETAAGTGVVTQRLATELNREVRIVATDLNQPMLDHARNKSGMERVVFQQADALALPFVDREFDLVVCQFGVMFFPDRIAGYREARRVLKPQGQFVFSVWDSLARNPLTSVVVEAMARRYPSDPPRFLARTPHGYHTVSVIRNELAAAGFAEVTIETVALPCRANSHRDPAIGFCQGTPMRGEIEARDPEGLQAATDDAADALAEQFGTDAIEAPMQAHVISAIPGRRIAIGGKAK